MSGETTEHVRDNYATTVGELYPGALVDYGEVTGVDSMVGVGDYACVRLVDDSRPLGHVFVTFENRPPVFVEQDRAVRVFKP